ncbi:hypothetical protein ACHMW6_07590 [Pseudoduganella sp. UC29_106]|uniref:hypothetical protein n=1 Tax=Pseudoduganella sp. UC29_106 TaxID=3374553 RepID=UPI0037578BBE
MIRNFFAAARAGVRRLGWALAPALLACGAAVAQPRVVYSPYQFLGLPGGTGRAAVVAPDGAAFPSGVALTWAFATGECGDEVWSGVPGQQVADANVAAFERAGLDFIISTGGQGGVFTCASDEGMARFLARYASPRFVGVDFDIEAEQTPAQIDSIVARARAAQRSAPRLRFQLYNRILCCFRRQPPQPERHRRGRAGGGPQAWLAGLCAEPDGHGLWACEREGVRCAGRALRYGRVGAAGGAQCA